MPRAHPVTGMVFVRSLQIGDNLRCVLLFCNVCSPSPLQHECPLFADEQSFSESDEATA
ncbi:hypothetical protein QVN77_10540 [Yersinia rohdei]|nr:hypothetical protein [Yersinia rohdei]